MVALPSRVNRYSFALVSVLLATGGGLLLEPALGPQLPFLALFLGVIASAAYGGLGPGLFATGFGAIVGVSLLPPTPATLAADGISYSAALGFLAVALGITLLGADSRRARQRAEALAAQAFRDRDQLQRGQAAQQLLASIVENSQDAIYGQALDGTITSWNAGAERLYGHSAKEALGQQSSILDVPPGGVNPSASMKEAQSATTYFDLVRRRRDSTLIDVSMSVSPLRNTHGVRVGSATIGRDITAQKRAAAELQCAQERLQDEDRRKDDFIAVLAHELRNPLAPLRNALLIMKRTEGSGPIALNSLLMAERQVNHLASLVDDLLDVARVTHGRIELRTERIDLSSALSRAAEAAKPTLEARGHALAVSLPEAPLWIEADAVRLAQILANLLTNAAQYTAPGGKIELSAEPRGAEAWIRVSDTGFGIPKEALPRIFDMFTQASAPQDRSPSSLGIGLRLAKGLVEMHGGRIEATSGGVGRGSVFLVRLPTAPPPMFDTPATSQLFPAALLKKNILVVDDNVDAATSLALLLKLQGHVTRAAHSGPDALKTIDAESPDIVVLDIGMPGMDGYEVARRIRQRVGAPPVTLVALTGWGQEHDRQSAQQAGFDYHMTKPLQPGALQKVIAGHQRH